MSFLDALIPGVIGLVLVAWPQAMFLGSKVTPAARKLRLLRIVGAVLLAVALLYLGIHQVASR